MRPVLAVALDLLREAASRKWFIGLWLVITALLLTLGLSLKMDVVDGALAGTRLFGKWVSTDIRSAEVAMRPVFLAAAYLIFYGGSFFMVLACADFAPTLLAPGRVEHLLALPVRRWQLLVGTYLGVLCLSTLAAAYGAGGLWLLLGFKTGSWPLGILGAAALATLNFAVLYAAMATSALFARSAAVSAAVGGGLFVLGIIAGARAELAPLFEPGFGRTTFEWATRLLPRMSTLANLAADLAGNRKSPEGALVPVLVGFAVYGAGLLALGIWRLEGKDF